MGRLKATVKVLSRLENLQAGQRILIDTSALIDFFQGVASSEKLW